MYLRASTSPGLRGVSNEKTEGKQTHISRLLSGCWRASGCKFRKKMRIFVINLRSCIDAYGITGGLIFKSEND